MINAITVQQHKSNAPWRPEWDAAIAFAKRQLRSKSQIDAIFDIANTLAANDRHRLFKTTGDLTGEVDVDTDRLTDRRTDLQIVTRKHKQMANNVILAVNANIFRLFK